MKRLKRFVRDWWECRTKRCTYYKHYLAYGPADLTHEGFHAAEEQCAYWQGKMTVWLKENEATDEKWPEGLSRMCESWEKRVRA